MSVNELTICCLGSEFDLSVSNWPSGRDRDKTIRLLARLLRVHVEVPRADRGEEIGVSLVTPERIRKLLRALYVKAKQEPTRRFRLARSAARMP
jgi:hypothetical protein